MSHDECPGCGSSQRLSTKDGIICAHCRRMLKPRPPPTSVLGPGRKLLLIGSTGIVDEVEVPW